MSPVLEEEPVKKPKKAKKPAKKSTIVPTSGVVIRDTPGVSVSKKKAPSKGDKGKGMELLSNAALLEATQVKEARSSSGSPFHSVFLLLIDSLIYIKVNWSIRLRYLSSPFGFPRFLSPFGL
ncbi:hypothetical protein Tco_0480553 [Tanacetum coccineum]